MNQITFGRGLFQFMNPLIREAIGSGSSVKHWMPLDVGHPPRPASTQSRSLRCWIRCQQQVCTQDKSYSHQVVLVVKLVKASTLSTLSRSHCKPSRMGHDPGGGFEVLAATPASISSESPIAWRTASISSESPIAWRTTIA